MCHELLDAVVQLVQWNPGCRRQEIEIHRVDVKTKMTYYLTIS